MYRLSYALVYICKMHNYAKRMVFVYIGAILWLYNCWSTFEGSDDDVFITATMITKNNLNRGDKVYVSVQVQGDQILNQVIIVLYSTKCGTKLSLASDHYLLYCVFTQADMRLQICL